MCKNLNEWLAVLEKLPSFNYVPGLGRIRKIAEVSNSHVFNCPVVTVAGTNGKGSCIAYLESILLNAGFRIGAYTSPHLLRFNERIRINGKEIDDMSLCRAFTELDSRLCVNDENVNYFEFVTLATLDIFQNHELDFLLLEVGLGGRLDPVNIVDPDIAVITTVAIDHSERLGYDREVIGSEKAGIMRKNAPIVYGDPLPPKSVLKHARTLKCPIYRLGQKFSYTNNNSNWEWQFANKRLLKLPLPLLATQSAATALMVIELLRSQFYIDDDFIYDGINEAYLPGRYQRLSRKKNVIVDVAHNPEAISFLAKRLATENCQGKTLAVAGMLQDKDIRSNLSAITDQIDVWYFADLNVKRGAMADDLQKVLREFNQKPCYTYESVESAYESAYKNCVENDIIIVFGSFYTVAEVLRKNSHNEDIFG